MYKVLKYLFQTLLVIEGLLIVVYATELTDLPYYLAAFPLYISFDLNLTYNNILRFIRDIRNYLINDEEIIKDTENYEFISIDNEKINNEKFINDINVNNNSYYWVIGITMVVTISGIIIYYYYPDVLNYFKDIDNENDSDLLDF